MEEPRKIKRRYAIPIHPRTHPPVRAPLARTPELLLIKEEGELESLFSDLEGFGYFHAASWQGLLNCLNLELPVFTHIGKALSFELCELMRQYARGETHIKIYDPRVRQFREALVSSTTPEVVFILSRENVETISEILN